MQVQGATSAAACHQFDPDTASAYLEQALSSRVLATYEDHLAACVSCRQHVIELSSLLPPRPVVTAPILAPASIRERWSQWLSGWRLGIVAGLGAVAATVLLVVVLVQRSKLESTSPLIATRQKETQATPLPKSAVPVESPTEFQRENKVGASGVPAADSPLPGNQTAARQTSAATPAPATSSPAGAPPSAAVPPLPAPPPVLSTVERKDVATELEANQRQMRDLRAQKPSGPEVNQQQGNRAGEDGKKYIPAPLADDAVQPASKTSESALESKLERQRIEDAVANRQAWKQRAITLSKPVPTKAINGKTFRQENGVWTDEAYEAKKGLPLVRVKYESEDYQQTLKDIPSLKPYFDLQSVIVVWQGKVYRVEK